MNNSTPSPQPPPFFSFAADSQMQSNQASSDSPLSSRARGESPDSLHSASSNARRARRGSQRSAQDSDVEERQPETQASLLDKVFKNADQSAKEEESGQRKAGRTEGALAWTGPELRALLISLQAHDVFDPNLSAEEHADAQAKVVADVNKWNQQHPRPSSKSAVRTWNACDNKWRKGLYKAIVAGENASKIASGPAEEDDSIMDICQQLKDQWELAVKDEKVKRAAKRKAAKPVTKAVDARDRATALIAKGMDDVKEKKREQKAKRLREEEEEEEEGEGAGEDALGDDDEGVETGEEGGGEDRKTKEKKKTKKRNRARKSDIASTGLIDAVAGMSAQQVQDSEKDREQQLQQHEKDREHQQQQHEEKMRQQDRAHDLARLQHREMLVREDRRLDLQERQLELDGRQVERVTRLEEKVEALSSTASSMFAFLKEKLQ